MDKMKLTIVMLIWGSIGLLTRFIDLSPISLAFLRALIAIPVLAIFQRKVKEKISLKDAWPYIISGGLIGLAWVSLFIAFKQVDISIAVLVYNMCPVYVIILSPFILKEKMNIFQLLTVSFSFLGLYLIIGQNVIVGGEQLVGTLFAVISGLLYATIVLINRKVNNQIHSMTATFIQMVSATIVLLPFTIIEGGLLHIQSLSITALSLVLTLGIVHTGITYALYFSTYKNLSAIEIVSFSYLEPLFSVLLGVLFLRETMSSFQLVGGLLILGFTYLNELRKTNLLKRLRKAL